MVAESLGNWHKVGLEQLRKLGSALGRHTGQEEGETISHLLARASVLLQKGLSALLLNRIRATQHQQLEHSVFKCLSPVNGMNWVH